MGQQQMENQGATCYQGSPTKWSLKWDASTCVYNSQNFNSYGCV